MELRVLSADAVRLCKQIRSKQRARLFGLVAHGDGTVVVVKGAGVRAGRIWLWLLMGQSKGLGLTWS